MKEKYDKKYVQLKACINVLWKKVMSNEIESWIINDMFPVVLKPQFEITDDNLCKHYKIATLASFCFETIRELLKHTTTRSPEHITEWELDYYLNQLLKAKQTETFGVMFDGVTTQDVDDKKQITVNLLHLALKRFNFLHAESEEKESHNLSSATITQFINGASLLTTKLLHNTQDFNFPERGNLHASNHLSMMMS